MLHRNITSLVLSTTPHHGLGKKMGKTRIYMENTLHKEKFYSELYKSLISFLLSLLPKDWPCWSGQPSTQEDTQAAQEKPWRLQC